MTHLQTTSIDILLEKRYIQSQPKFTLLDWWWDKDNKGKPNTILSIKTQYNFLELCEYIETKYPHKEYYVDYPNRVTICGKLKRPL